MYFGDFPPDHYERMYDEFRQLALDEGFINDPKAELIVKDHVLEGTIDVTQTAARVELILGVDSDNELVMTQDPAMVKKQAREVNKLVGVYAHGVEINAGPTIPDAEIADLNRIVEVMQGAKYKCINNQQKERWDSYIGRILLGRGGQSVGTNNAAAMLTRGMPLPVGNPRIFPKLKIFRPGDKDVESIVYDGSLWAGTPAVAANFKVKRVLHMFIAHNGLNG